MFPGQNWNNIAAKYFGKQRMRGKSRVKLLKAYYSELTTKFNDFIYCHVESKGLYFEENIYYFRKEQSSE